MSVTDDGVDLERAKRIRVHNDTLRTTFLTGRIIMTDTVALSADREAIITAVREFSNWGPNNDPYFEHDFGKVEINDESYFWKIDYYNRSMDGGSEDPSDPRQTARVLTIMHASEY